MFPSVVCDLACDMVVLGEKIIRIDYFCGMFVYTLTTRVVKKYTTPPPLMFQCVADENYAKAWLCLKLVNT